MKQRFLAVDDYGMGSIWLYIDARSADEIERAYPELKAFTEPPDFVTEEQLDKIGSELRFDIDDTPRGYLADLLAARERAGRQDEMPAVPTTQEQLDWDSPPDSGRGAGGAESRVPRRPVGGPNAAGAAANPPERDPGS